jgi:penicillin V acylase-like amidase (Ntn superfamily)
MAPPDPRRSNGRLKYGSMIAAGFDVATADGMNEKGLVANLLYLVESEYVKPGADDKRRPLPSRIGENLNLKCLTSDV